MEIKMRTSGKKSNRIQAYLDSTCDIMNLDGKVGEKNQNFK
jgi:hypothetical protein